MQALNSLSKNEIAEVKSFSKPPDRVKLVMDAVMILRESEPSWTEAKRQLGDPNFLLQVNTLAFKQNKWTYIVIFEFFS